MFVHGGALHWFTVEMWKPVNLFRMPLSGGAPEKLNTFEAPFKHLTFGGVLGKHAVIGHTASTFKLPLGPGEPEAKEWKDWSIGATATGAIAFDDKHVYFSTGSSEVHRAPVAGGGKAELLEKHYATDIIIDGDAVFWLSWDDADGMKARWVTRFAKSGKLTRVDLKPADKAHLALASGAIIVAATSGGAGGAQTQLLSAAKTGGKPEVLHQLPHDTHDMVLLGQHAYLLSEGDSGMALTRVALGDGKADTIATFDRKVAKLPQDKGGSDVGELVTSQDTVFVRIDCHIMAVPVQ